MICGVVDGGVLQGGDAPRRRSRDGAAPIYGIRVQGVRLAFKAHEFLYHSTPGSRVMKRKKKFRV